MEFEQYLQKYQIWFPSLVYHLLYLWAGGEHRLFEGQKDKKWTQLGTIKIW